MKTIGLIGGTGWVSSAEYYRLINEMTNKRLGGLNFAYCVLYSLNYGDLDLCNRENDTAGFKWLLREAAARLKSAKVDGLALCANTTHLAFDEIQELTELPMVHIADATGNEILKRGFRKVGLLGTKQTMEMDFYQTRLKAMGIDCVVPDLPDRDYIHDVIMNELLKSEFKDESRQKFIDIMQGLVGKGAEGVILGCTEIPLLVKQEDTEIPLFDTLHIHASAIVDFILESDKS
jgi:aspartate racemase